MKKTLSLLLALLLALPLLCACGNKSTTPGVPDGCERLESAALDFRFCYPKTWEPDRDDGMLSVRYNVGTALHASYASVSAMAFALSDLNTGANDYWDGYRSELEKNFPGIEFLKEKEECALGGVIANRNRAKYAQDGIDICFETVVCIRAGYVYLVTLTTPERNYSDTVPGFETILDTFEFV